jgi:hypothetical protein
VKRLWFFEIRWYSNGWLSITISCRKKKRIWTYSFQDSLWCRSRDVKIDRMLYTPHTLSFTILRLVFGFISICIIAYLLLYEGKKKNCYFNSFLVSALERKRRIQILIT